MAVAASPKTDPWTGSLTTYIFTVDTRTGAHIGKANKFIHGSTDSYKMMVLN